MPTNELANSLQSLNPEQQRFALAIGIVLDRVRRLPKEDSDDLFRLIVEYREAESEEDRDAADQAIMEMLEPSIVTIEEMELEARDVDDSLDRWTGFVSGKIREAREAAGLTQQALADKSGLPQSHISRIENGVHSPSHLTIERIAKALDVPISRFDPGMDDGFPTSSR